MRLVILWNKRVMRSRWWKYRHTAYIIFTEFINAGTPSKILRTSPTYIGSSAFSSVVRYLTLSLDSFAASVTRMSISFQRLCAADRAAPHTPKTQRHSRLFSCSITELNLAMRERQYSSSVSGPISSESRRPPELASSAKPESSNCSVASHQSSKTRSMSPATALSVAASANADARISIPAYFCGGLASSTPPCSECAASASVAPNLATPRTNSLALSSRALPQVAECCDLSTGAYRFEIRARNDSSAPPLISPAATSCSHPFSPTPLSLTRTKYSACELGSSAAFAPSVTTSRREGASPRGAAESPELTRRVVGGASASSDW